MLTLLSGMLSYVERVACCMTPLAQTTGAPLINLGESPLKDCYATVEQAKLLLCATPLGVEPHALAVAAMAA